MFIVNQEPRTSLTTSDKQGYKKVLEIYCVFKRYK
jgi:hypothetical protein